MSEETVSADKTAALGIVLAVGCSSIAGLMYVLALMFSVQVSPHTSIPTSQHAVTMSIGLLKLR